MSNLCVLVLVDEVSKIMDNINTSLAHCIPLLHFLNNQLPDDLRLETFRLREVAPVSAAEDVDSTAAGHRPTGQDVTQEEEVELYKDVGEVKDVDVSRASECQVEEDKGDEVEGKLNDLSRTGSELLDPEGVVKEEAAVAEVKELGLKEKVEDGTEVGGADRDGTSVVGGGATEVLT